MNVIARERTNGPNALAMFGDPELLADACRSEGEFERNFGTEERCERWFMRRRWPNGFRCARCGCGGRWNTEKRGYECVRCRKVTSITAGTLLHGTRKPLRKWFEALYLVVQRGVNARVLQREIGLTYKVAWSWGHKLRALLATFAVPEEVRPPREKAHVLFDAERVRNGPRPRMPEPDGEGPCCERLLKRDWAWPDEMGEEREAARLWLRYALGTPAGELWPERMRGFDEPRARDDLPAHELLATYYGSLSEKHLRAYLDEVAFRWNRRWRPTGDAFRLVAPALVSSGPRTYKEIVAKAPPEGHAISIFGCPAAPA